MKVSKRFLCFCKILGFLILLSFVFFFQNMQKSLCMFLSTHVYYTLRIFWFSKQRLRTEENCKNVNTKKQSLVEDT